MKKIAVITCFALLAGFSSCTVRSHVPAGTIPSDGSEYSGKSAAYYNHAEGIKEYMIKGATDVALQCFMKAIEADSLYAPAYYQIAEIQMETNPEQALRYSRKAIMLDSTNLTYRSQLGRALIMSDGYNEAMDIYTRLMKEDQNNPVNYRLLAALYDYKGQPFSAVMILDTAEYRLGRIEELSTYKRELLMSVRLYDKAVQETEKLIEEYPYDDDNYRIMGDLYAVMGKDSLALDNYGQALKIDSANINTLKSMADYYIGRNDERNYLSVLNAIFKNDGMSLKEKEMVFQRVTNDVEFYRRNYLAVSSLAGTLMLKYPTDYEAVNMYATHLIRSGEVNRALEVYKSFIAQGPPTENAFRNIIDIEAYLQRPDSVALYADRAVDAGVGSMDITLSKGYAYSSMGDYDTALKTFKQAYEQALIDPQRSIVAGIMGDTYNQKGDEKRCYAQYRKALRLDPKNAGVLNNYAYFLSEDGKDLKNALSMSEKSNELSPKNSTYMDTMGWILYLLGRYDEARQIMLQAISFDSTNSEVLLFHYAEILYAQGDNFMAEVYWKRARDRGYDPVLIEERLQMVKK